MTETFSIRALKAEDWAAYRAIRLEALTQFPGNYGATHREEAALSDQAWIDRITDDKGCVFGMFKGAELIGTNVVYTYRDDPAGKTALMIGWYMREDYRGKGLFARLVQAGVEWAQAQERFDRIRVHHRGGNHASRANIIKAGFTHIGTEDWTWPDGVTEDFCMYERTFER